MTKKQTKRNEEPQVKQKARRHHDGQGREGLEARNEEPDLLALQRAVANPAMASPADILALQRAYGNQAVQRLLAQRQGGGEGFVLDDETAGRINRARGGGQPLDSAVQEQMSAGQGYDFSEVRVHTGPEADALNQELNARAFTTGQDIFFRQGEYNPGSDSGRELIAHELTHVVQQGTGRVSAGGSGMTVRPAGDAFEQKADALSRRGRDIGGAGGRGSVGDAGSGSVVQRQPRCVHCGLDLSIYRDMVPNRDLHQLGNCPSPKCGLDRPFPLDQVDWWDPQHPIETATRPAPAR